MYGNHFKFTELIHTDLPESNYPSTPEQLQNLSALWDELNQLRDKLNHPIYINSAFRTESINKQVCGAKRSLHMKGRSADIRTHPFYMEELWQLLEENKHNYSELIKYSTFYHNEI